MRVDDRKPVEGPKAPVVEEAPKPAGVKAPPQAEALVVPDALAHGAPAKADAGPALDLPDEDPDAALKRLEGERDAEKKKLQALTPKPKGHEKEIAALQQNLDGLERAILVHSWGRPPPKKGSAEQRLASLELAAGARKNDRALAAARDAIGKGDEQALFRAYKCSLPKGDKSLFDELKVPKDHLAAFIATGAMSPELQAALEKARHPPKHMHGPEQQAFLRASALALFCFAAASHRLEAERAALLADPKHSKDAVAKINLRLTAAMGAHVAFLNANAGNQKAVTAEVEREIKKLKKDALDPNVSEDKRTQAGIGAHLRYDALNAGDEWRAHSLRKQGHDKDADDAWIGIGKRELDRAPLELAFNRFQAAAKKAPLYKTGDDVAAYVDAKRALDEVKDKESLNYGETLSALHKARGGVPRRWAAARGRVASEEDVADLQKRLGALRNDQKTKDKIAIAVVKAREEARKADQDPELAAKRAEAALLGELEQGVRNAWQVEQQKKQPKASSPAEFVADAQALAEIQIEGHAAFAALEKAEKKHAPRFAVMAKDEQRQLLRINIAKNQELDALLGTATEGEALRAALKGAEPPVNALSERAAKDALQKAERAAAAAKHVGITRGVAAGVSQGLVAGQSDEQTADIDAAEYRVIAAKKRLEIAQLAAAAKGAGKPVDRVTQKALEKEVAQAELHAAEADLRGDEARGKGILYTSAADKDKIARAQGRLRDAKAGAAGAKKAYDEAVADRPAQQKRRDDLALRDGVDAALAKGGVPGLAALRAKSATVVSESYDLAEKAKALPAEERLRVVSGAFALERTHQKSLAAEEKQKKELVVRATKERLAQDRALAAKEKGVSLLAKEVENDKALDAWLYGDDGKFFGFQISDTPKKEAELAGEEAERKALLGERNAAARGEREAKRALGDHQRERSAHVNDRLERGATLAETIAEHGEVKDPNARDPMRAVAVSLRGEQAVLLADAGLGGGAKDALDHGRRVGGAIGDADRRAGAALELTNAGEQAVQRLVHQRQIGRRLSGPGGALVRAGSDGEVQALQDSADAARAAGFVSLAKVGKPSPELDRALGALLGADAMREKAAIQRAEALHAIADKLKAQRQSAKDGLYAAYRDANIGVSDAMNLLTVGASVFGVLATEGRFASARDLAFEDNEKQWKEGDAAIDKAIDGDVRFFDAAAVKAGEKGLAGELFFADLLGAFDDDAGPRLGPLAAGAKAQAGDKPELASLRYGEDAGDVLARAQALEVPSRQLGEIGAGFDAKADFLRENQRLIQGVQAAAEIGLSLGSGSVFALGGKALEAEVLAAKAMRFLEGAGMQMGGTLWKATNAIVRVGASMGHMALMQAVTGALSLSAQKLFGASGDAAKGVDLFGAQLSFGASRAATSPLWLRAIRERGFAKTLKSGEFWKHTAEEFSHIVASAKPMIVDFFVRQAIIARMADPLSQAHANEVMDALMLLLPAVKGYHESRKKEVLDQPRVLAEALGRMKPGEVPSAAQKVIMLEFARHYLANAPSSPAEAFAVIHDAAKKHGMDPGTAKVLAAYGTVLQPVLHLVKEPLPPAAYEALADLLEGSQGKKPAELKKAIAGALEAHAPKLSVGEREVIAGRVAKEQVLLDVYDTLAKTPAKKLDEGPLVERAVDDAKILGLSHQEQKTLEQDLRALAARRKAQEPDDALVVGHAESRQDSQAAEKKAIVVTDGMPVTDAVEQAWKNGHEEVYVYVGEPPKQTKHKVLALEGGILRIDGDDGRHGKEGDTIADTIVAIGVGPNGAEMHAASFAQDINDVCFTSEAQVRAERQFFAFVAERPKAQPHPERPASDPLAAIEAAVRKGRDHARLFGDPEGQASDPVDAPEAMGGACVEAQAVVAFHFEGSNAIVNWHRTEGIFKTELGHSFTVVETPDGHRYVIDPTFAQFFATKDGKAHAGGEVGQRLVASKEGAALAKEILEKGYFELTDKNAELYAKAFNPKTKRTKADDFVEGDSAAPRERATKGMLERTREKAVPRVPEQPRASHEPVDAKLDEPAFMSPKVMTAEGEFTIVDVSPVGFVTSVRVQRLVDGRIEERSFALSDLAERNPDRVEGMYCRIDGKTQVVVGFAGGKFSLQSNDGSLRRMSASELFNRAPLELSLRLSPPHLHLNSSLAGPPTRKPAGLVRDKGEWVPFFGTIREPTAEEAAAHPGRAIRIVQRAAGIERVVDASDVHAIVAAAAPQAYVALEGKHADAKAPRRLFAIAEAPVKGTAGEPLHVVWDPQAQAFSLTTLRGFHPEVVGSRAILVDPGLEQGFNEARAKLLREDPKAVAKLDALVAATGSAEEQFMLMKVFTLHRKVDDVERFQNEIAWKDEGGARVRRTPLEILRLGTAEGAVQYFASSCAIATLQYRRMEADPRYALEAVLGGPGPLIREQGELLIRTGSEVVARDGALPVPGDPERSMIVVSVGQKGAQQGVYFGDYVRLDNERVAGPLGLPPLVGHQFQVDPKTKKESAIPPATLEHNLALNLAPGRMPRGGIPIVIMLGNGAHLVNALGMETRVVIVDGRPVEKRFYVLRDPGLSSTRPEEPFTRTVSADELQNPSGVHICAIALPEGVPIELPRRDGEPPRLLETKVRARAAAAGAVDEKTKPVRSAGWDEKTKPVSPDALDDKTKPAGQEVDVIAAFELAARGPRFAQPGSVGLFDGLREPEPAPPLLTVTGKDGAVFIARAVRRGADGQIASVSLRDSRGVVVERTLAELRRDTVSGVLVAGPKMQRWGPDAPLAPPPAPEQLALVDAPFETKLAIVQQTAPQRTITVELSTGDPPAHKVRQARLDGFAPDGSPRLTMLDNLPHWTPEATHIDGFHLLASPGEPLVSYPLDGAWRRQTLHIESGAGVLHLPPPQDGLARAATFLKAQWFAAATEGKLRAMFAGVRGGYTLTINDSVVLPRGDGVLHVELAVKDASGKHVATAVRQLEPRGEPPSRSLRIKHEVLWVDRGQREEDLSTALDAATDALYATLGAPVEVVSKAASGAGFIGLARDERYAFADAAAREQLAREILALVDAGAELRAGDGTKIALRDKKIRDGLASRLAHAQTPTAFADLSLDIAGQKQPIVRWLVEQHGAKLALPALVRGRGVQDAGGMPAARGVKDVAEWVWEHRASILNDGDIYEQNTRGEPNPLSLVGPSGERGARDAYLGRVAAIEQGRPPGSPALSQAYGLRYSPAAVAQGLKDAPQQFAKADNDFFHYYRKGASGAAEERIYVNARADHAPAVMAFVVRRIIDDPAAFPGVVGGKIAGPESATKWADNIVLYFETKEARDRVLVAMADYQRQHPGHFMSGVPALTERLMPGVAVAVEPGPEAVARGQAAWARHRNVASDSRVFSFSRHRASAFFLALEDTRKANGDQAHFLARLKERFVEFGIDPEHPSREVVTR
ncbi:MAG: hypothetical protein IT381_01370 [Deltaproteobacteria bacterium]|nr:hypothetical protein [Deltaproteobacteria bacterium]